MLPFYNMKIDEETEGMDFIALVDSPAHRKTFEFFNGKKPVKQHFNDEQRIVTGVAIAVDLPIYRKDAQFGEHYVVFSKEDTKKIAQKMFKSGYSKNVNEMHDSNRKVEDVYLFESYFIDSKAGKTVPDSFKDQNLKDGSWIVSYKVDNDEAWNNIKSGKHVGFSIEGWFNKEKINLKTKKQTKMAKETKGKFWNILFPTKEEFTEATTVDGSVIIWDGELTEGTELKIKGEDADVLAPEGSYSVDNDGVISVIAVDGNGIVTSVTTEGGEGSEEEMSEMQKAMIEFKKLMDEGFAEIKADQDKFRTNLEDIAKELDSDSKRKFSNTPSRNWRNAKG